MAKRGPRPGFRRAALYLENISGDNWTVLWLALIAPVGPGHPDFDEIVLEFNRWPMRMRREPQERLRGWIKEFQAGWRRVERLGGGRLSRQEVVSDRWFIERMFYAYAHQFNLQGHRIGPVDCRGLSVKGLNFPGHTGKTGWSQAWVFGNRAVRRRLKFIGYLQEEGTR